MLPLTIASTAMTFNAHRQQGEIAMETARHNADVLKAQDAQDKQVTAERMRRRRVENTRVLSAIRNRMGSSGLRSDMGSSADYIRKATERLELGILDEAQGQEYRSKARENRRNTTLWQGQNAQDQSRYMANASLLEGGAQIAGQGYDIYNNSKKGEFAWNAFGPGGLTKKWF